MSTSSCEEFVNNPPSYDIPNLSRAQQSGCGNLLRNRVEWRRCRGHPTSYATSVPGVRSTGIPIDGALTVVAEKERTSDTAGSTS